MFEVGKLVRKSGGYSGHNELIKVTEITKGGNIRCSDNNLYTRKDDTYATIRGGLGWETTAIHVLKEGEEAKIRETIANRKIVEKIHKLKSSTPVPHYTNPNLVEILELWEKLKNLSENKG